MKNPPKGKHEPCPVCGERVLVLTGDRYSAHRRPLDNRWCKGGDGGASGKGTKKKRKAKRSVWAVSGGLPTLGRND